MPNSEEIFVQQIIDLTCDDKLKWEPSNFSKYSNIIINPHQGIRIFESETLDKCFQGKKNAQNRNFILFEIKNISFHTDLEEYFESKSIVLMLLNKNELERTFDSSTISSDILYNLIETISNKANNTDDFIDSLLN